MTRFNTQLVHGLPVGDNNTGAVNPPIYNSTTYAFEKSTRCPAMTTHEAAIPRATSWKSRSHNSNKAREASHSPPDLPRFMPCSAFSSPAIALLWGQHLQRLVFAAQ